MYLEIFKCTYMFESGYHSTGSAKLLTKPTCFKQLVFGSSPVYAVGLTLNLDERNRSGQKMLSFSLLFIDLLYNMCHFIGNV